MKDQAENRRKKLRDSRDGPETGLQVENSPTHVAEALQGLFLTPDEAADLRRRLVNLALQRREDSAWAEDLAQGYVTDLLKKSSAVRGSDPWEELRTELMDDFVKFAVNPAITAIKDDKGLRSSKPLEEVGALDRAVDPEREPYENILAEAVDEAAGEGFRLFGLAWAERLKKVDHLVIAHLLRAVARGKIGWAEACEVLEMDMAGKTLRFVPRESQRPLLRAFREASRDRREDPASAEALARIRKAQAALRRERAEREPDPDPE